MTIVLFSICLLAVSSNMSATPIRDSVERIAESYAVDHQVVSVPGFESVGVKKPKQKKFFGLTNQLMGVGLLGFGVVDAETTLACISTTGQTTTTLPNGGTRVEMRSCVESKKFMRPFVARGRWAAYGGKAIVDVPLWVGSHYLRRSPQRSLQFAGWALPVIGMAVQAKFAADNVRETNWVRTGHR